MSEDSSPPTGARSVPPERVSRRPRSSEESTGPFELARLRGPAKPAAPVAAPRALLPSARRTAWLAALNMLLYLAVAALGVARYRADPNAIFEVVLSILALGLAGWGASTSRYLFRAARGGPEAGHALAAAFSAARSVFILKGTGLFLILAISCFAFSAILSVFAFL